MKIDILVADCPYGTTPHFSKALAAGLEKEGAHARLHWIDDFFRSALNNPPDFTCSFSDIHMNGQPLAALWNIPHLSMLVDPAIYFQHHIHPNSYISCVDPNDVPFLNHKNAFYLPHGGDPAHLTPPDTHRPYDVVFFGTCLDLPPPHPLGDAILTKQGPTLLETTTDPELHHTLDLYIRAKDRIDLLNSLKDHNLHIWGSGPWEKYVPHATIHPPIPFTETVEIMKQAKVVVNSSPRLKNGWHERLFYGALCGAAPLSAHPLGYSYTYGLYEPQDFTNWQEVAACAQAEVLAHHTWAHRAKTLLHHLQRA